MILQGEILQKNLSGSDGVRQKRFRESEIDMNLTNAESFVLPFWKDNFCMMTDSQTRRNAVYFY